MKKDKILIIYHKSDIDGLISGAIATNYYLGFDVEVTTFGIEYGDYIIYDFDSYDKVVILDVVLPAVYMINHKDKIIWIDHHKTAMDISSKYKYDDIVGIRTINQAACELAWQYYHPDIAIPEIITLFGQYDTFRHVGKDNENKVVAIQYAARNYITNLKSAKQVLAKSSDTYYINQLYYEGKAIITHIVTQINRELDKNLHGKFYDKEGNDFILQMLNTSINPKAFVKIDPYNIAIVTFNIISFDKVKLTFYSNNDAFDVSNLALAYGGGGHKGAAGAYITVKKLNKILIPS